MSAEIIKARGKWLLEDALFRSHSTAWLVRAEKFPELGDVLKAAKVTAAEQGGLKRDGASGSPSTAPNPADSQRAIMAGIQAAAAYSRKYDARMRSERPFDK